MKALNVRQQQRWEFAKNQIASMLAVAKRAGAKLMHDGMVIELEEVKVVDDTILVQRGNTRWIIFQADPDMDAGLYDTTTEFSRSLRKHFKIIKELHW